jgi:tetratricopeptide (TPR) repeat protein
VDEVPKRQQGWAQWREHWWWLLPLLLGAAVRTPPLLSVASNETLQRFLLLDAQLYAQMARRIASGDWLLGSDPFAVGPLYAYVVGGLWRLFGESHPLIFEMQAVVGLGSVFLVTRSARGLSSTTGACVAGCAFALYAPTIMLEGRLLSETLAVFLTLVAIHLLTRSVFSRQRLAFAGLCIGAASLLRPDLLLAIPAIAGVILLGSAGRSSADPSFRSTFRASARGNWRRCVVFIAAATAVVALATVRNWVVLDEPVLVSAQGGVTFYQGNNERAGGTFSIPQGFTGRKRTQEEEARDVAQEALGRTLGYGEVSSYWYDQGVAFLMHDPGRGMTLLLHKLRYWTSSMELSADYGVRAARCLQPALACAFVPFGAFLVATLFGWRTAIRREPRTALLHLVFAVLGLVVGLAFYVSTRYRLCAAVHMAVFLGPALDSALGWQAPTWGNMRRAVAAATLGLTLVHWTDAEKFQAATELRNLGVNYYNERQLDRAIPLLLAARNARPDNWEIRYSLAHALGVLGDTKAAAAELKRAAELRPDSAETRRYLLEYRARADDSRPVHVAPICEL